MDFQKILLDFGILLLFPHHPLLLFCLRLVWQIPFRELLLPLSFHRLLNLSSNLVHLLPFLDQGHLLVHQIKLNQVPSLGLLLLLFFVFVHQKVLLDMNFFYLIGQFFLTNLGLFFLPDFFAFFLYLRVQLIGFLIWSYLKKD
ncbi:hypothetical protein HMPREF9246_1275 [Anaerococcus hydrogenalis ACS-025-V-Sch4]|uniref:Uncharacterized protein n=1 Tax=Anaerococcus hydrogenalis ACS-025-V-Sch4 TaxID=879306 RepID=F0H1S0_9FIRM|nr:hypothetical protein HMPREF9246_1275 [Anaerococcus hydrogenalis ACS-025-V-Sch4]